MNHIGEELPPSRSLAAPVAVSHRRLMKALDDDVQREWSNSNGPNFCGRSAWRSSGVKHDCPDT